MVLLLTIVAGSLRCMDQCSSEVESGKETYRWILTRDSANRLAIQAAFLTCQGVKSSLLTAFSKLIIDSTFS